MRVICRKKKGVFQLNFLVVKSNSGKLLNGLENV
jgi:hypothetical protein